MKLTRTILFAAVVIAFAAVAGYPHKAEPAEHCNWDIPMPAAAVKRVRASEMDFASSNWFTDTGDGYNRKAIMVLCGEPTSPKVKTDEDAKLLIRETVLKELKAIDPQLAIVGETPWTIGGYKGTSYRLFLGSGYVELRVAAKRNRGYAVLIMTTREDFYKELQNVADKLKPRDDDGGKQGADKTPPKAVEPIGKDVNSLLRNAMTNLQLWQGVEAAADVEKAIELDSKKQNAGNTAIIRFIGYMIADEAEKAYMVVNLFLDTKPPESEFTTKAMEYFADRITAQQLIAAAGPNKVRMTQAHLYIGLMESFACLRAHDPQVGRKHLLWVRTNGLRTSPEYDIAAAAIKALTRPKQ